MQIHMMRQHRMEHALRGQVCIVYDGPKMDAIELEYDVMQPAQ